MLCLFKYALTIISFQSHTATQVVTNLGHCCPHVCLSLIFNHPMKTPLVSCCKQLLTFSALFLKYYFINNVIPKIGAQYSSYAEQKVTIMIYQRLKVSGKEIYLLQWLATGKFISIFFHLMKGSIHRGSALHLKLRDESIQLQSKMMSLHSPQKIVHRTEHPSIVVRQKKFGESIIEK